MTLTPSRRLDDLDPVEAWKPWTPDAAHPWGLKWAGHLYRWVAFGATWAELQAAVRDGPEATIRKLLTPGEGQDDFDRLMDALGPETG
ncbi:MAG TPA: hypothetical protein VNK04_06250, partial [Gemmataceae bacterium]|nr:hypothetical protein [Gemmataceae bacterium]